MIQVNTNVVVLPSTSVADDLHALRDQSRHLLVELEHLCAESDADLADIGHIRESLTDIGNRIAGLKLKKVRS